MPETEIKTLVRQSLQLPARCATALPRGSTLEMGEKRWRGKRGEKTLKKTKKQQACSNGGLHLLCSKQWILRPLWGLTVVKNSQRGPPFPTENIDVRSVFADFQETQPKTDLQQPLYYLPSQRQASISSSSSLKMLAQEIITTNCSSLKWVTFFGLQISKIKNDVEQQDILITDNFCSVHF